MRVIEIERGGELRGAVTGGALGLAMSAPLWMILVLAPALTFVFLGLVEELSEERLSTFYVVLVGAFVGTMIGAA